MNEVEFQSFVRLHQNQLDASSVPEHYWRTIFRKVTEQIFDVGKVFTLIQIDYEDDERGPYDPVFQVQVRAEDGISVNDSNHIYLIDHAWTFRAEFARNQLLSVDHLRKRMAMIMGLKDDDKHALTEKIFNELWRYANSYSIGNAESIEERMPVWYIMDEVGCGIAHHGDGNFRMVPFIYTPENMTYSLVFPMRDCVFAERVTRDFGEGHLGGEREAFLLPWVDKPLEKHDHQHIVVSPDYFLGGHVKETLPILANLCQHTTIKNKTIYKVYTQYEYVAKYLTDARFQLVRYEEDADILWYTSHFKRFEELSLNFPHTFVNQFPFEYILTIKDLLSVTCRRKDGKILPDLSGTPKWLPITYNLKTEIVQFVSFYRKRKAAGLDNHWIIKPFNLARGLDTHITDNLNYILRLPETGAKIAQKYLEKPVLFERPEIGRVKFDIRYVVLLKKTKPLEVYAYKNFFLRFANRPFAMDNFDVYEQHFTVMNYTDGGSRLKHMLCSDFKVEWDKQYPDQVWGDVEEKIFAMLKEVFECAVIEPPPCGISESPQSRAVYAADIMLAADDVDDIQPKLLEVNWTPDCKRACEYYPDFYNDIFKFMFLDIEKPEVFHRL